MARRTRTRHIFSTASSRDPASRMRLPGCQNVTEMHDGIDVTANKFGMIWMPRTKQATVVVRLYPAPPESEETSVASVEDWIREWALDATMLTPPPVGENPSTLDAAVIVVDAATDVSGGRHGAGGVDLDVRLALTVTVAGAPEDAMMVLAELLPQLYARLSGWLVSVQPLRSTDLVAISACAFDPTYERHALVTDALRSDDRSILVWADGGPEFSDPLPDWALYSHDGGMSASWAAPITAANLAIDATPVITPLLGPLGGAIVRARVAVTMRPQGPHTEPADANLRDAHGDDAALTPFVATVTYTCLADDPVQGHQAGAVTPALADLARDVRSRTRRCYGQQEGAFSAGLGVGVLLPDHHDPHAKRL